MHPQERRLPEEEHMPREAEHNKLEPGHNTLLEEVYNIQPGGSISDWWLRIGWCWLILLLYRVISLGISR